MKKNEALIIKNIGGGTFVDASDPRPTKHENGVDFNNHGGKRIPGPGKKLGPPASPFPYFLKKLRATDEERAEFMSKLTGDARRDFVILLEALRKA
jgi:hypothetical protein